jgi:hypothetical protein
LPFISVEAVKSQYIFAPHPPKIGDDLLKDADYILEEPHVVKPSIPWAYNHLQDLESLWWVAAWIFFNNLFSDLAVNTSPPQEPGVLPSVSREPLDGLRMGLFPCTSDTNRLTTSFESEVPTQYARPLRGVGRARPHLIEHYVTVESTLPSHINLDASNHTICASFGLIFKILRSGTPNYTLCYIPQLRTELAKRQREEPT